MSKNEMIVCYNLELSKNISLELDFDISKKEYEKELNRAESRELLN